MKKIITAIGNSKINKKLILENKYEIIFNDIQYKDAIIEIINLNKKIDILILNKNLPGEIELDKLVIEIKKKKIRLILIDESNIKKYKKDIRQLIKVIENERNYMEKNEIISITGTRGVGKSLTSLNLAFYFNYKKNIRILIIGFDKYYQSVFSIFKLNKKINIKIKINQIKKSKNYFGKNQKIKFLKIKKINKKINYLFFYNNYLKNKKIIKNIFKKTILEKYNLIIFDLGENCDEKIKKYILNKSDKILFLIESNLLVVKNAKEELQKLENKNIEIVINKWNKNCLDMAIIKEIFFEYKILGKINYNENYNKYINEKYKNFSINKELKKDYKVLLKKYYKN